MGLLQPVKVEQAAAKVGIFGPQGSGKTTTTALMLLGLSLTYHNGAPVVFLDTENGSDYLKQIFDAEGVSLLVAKSRAFQDMRQALREAEEQKACGYMVDSYTHPWMELMESFKARSRRKKLEFHHMDELKSMWRQWTDQMLNSPLHVVLCGRLGFNWDREDDGADGEKGDLVKLGSKMKGEAEAGYEPSLLIELEGIQKDSKRIKGTRAKKGNIAHYAYVLKDRWRSLNGRTFAWDDMNAYKKGDWRKVYDVFAPHFKMLAIGEQQRAVNGNRNSEALFSGNPAEFGRRRDIALEEIKETIASVFPGQSADQKARRQAVLECQFGTLSWSKVESLGLESLETSARILRTFKDQARADQNLITSDAGTIALLQMCKDAAAVEAELDPVL